MTVVKLYISGIYNLCVSVDGESLCISDGMREWKAPGTAFTDNAGKCREIVGRTHTREFKEVLTCFSFQYKLQNCNLY